MRINKWVHPDLEHPVYLSESAYAPIELLPEGSDRRLLKAESLKMTRAEFNELRKQCPNHAPETEDDVDAALEEADASADEPAEEEPLEQVAPPASRSDMISTIAATCPWRRVARQLLESEITYGSVITTTHLEEALGIMRDDVKFHFAICNIRRLFRSRFGFYLTGRGQRGERYLILPASQNVDVMASDCQRASNCLANALSLGAKTDRGVLTIEERRRHDSMMEKVALKQVLINKADVTRKVLEATPAGRLLLTAQA